MTPFTSKIFPNIAKLIVIIVLLLIVVGLSVFLIQNYSISKPAYQFGLIGNDGKHLAEELEAGINLRLFSLSWRDLVPTEGLISDDYLQRKRDELVALNAAGFSIILSMGIHDTPPWIHENYENTYFINQFGNPYSPDEPDAGTANLVFNTQLRDSAAEYIETVFSLFGTDFFAVRVGGGRYGELTYPPAEYADISNNYWAFDANALSSSPVPNWIPAEASPNGEAAAFLDWYLAALTAYQNWQIETVRQVYSGNIMILYPSWGIRPGNIAEAISTNLDGSSSAEHHGEIQRGFDFEQQIAAITDPNVIVTTTWLDADASQDSGEDQRYWSPVKYLSMLAHNHPLNLRMFGENTGHGIVEDMRLTVAQMQTYGLIGMLWFRENELFNPEFASLEDYRQIIAETNR